LEGVYWATYNALEKKVVVVGHGGEVEGVCFYGVARELDDEGFDFLVLQFGDVYDALCQPFLPHI
jgi:hypothetical protein